MKQQATEMKKISPLVERLERERSHFNNVARRRASQNLVMARSNIERYRNPPATTPFPLEYAFHLLGDLRGKTVVDLGCGEGLNTVILASLGAKVLAVDISDESLELTGARAQANGVEANVKLLHSDAATIPIEDGAADRVLCAAILHHVDSVATGLQIRRILKPGGIAVFEEPLAGPRWFQRLKEMLPKAAHNTDDERPLTPDQVRAVSNAVGRGGRQREFVLFATRLAFRAGVRAERYVLPAYRFDGQLLKYAPFVRPLASPVVWEAMK